MAIVFQGPPAGFDPHASGAFKGVPDEPGVYIVGVKISVDGDGENVKKFCPLYVGETSNLRRRISDHHDPNHSNARLEDSLLNFTKELFDISLGVSVLYNSIKQWNFAHWNFSVNLPKVFGFSPSTRYAKKKKEGEKGNMYRAINGAVAMLPLPPKPLINFNCPTFFDSFLGSFNISNYRENTGHQGAIDDLNRIIGSTASLDMIARAITLRDKIIQTKNIISNNFYFAYWRENGDCNRRIIEGATKKALETIDIYTYGDAQYFPGSYDINLSPIQANLVNLTGAPFETLLIISV